MDDRQSTYYALIGYCHAYQGDVDRALAAWDRYGAALPPNDPNPIDGRGDVLVANERYEQAAAEYRKNLELHPAFFSGITGIKLARIYLYQRKYALAEASAQAQKDVEPAWWVGRAEMLGDIEVGRGRLESAAAQYEEAARMYSKKGDLTRPGIFLKAGQVYFEQRQPEAALALGRRLASPWAAGLRGTAYLLLKNQEAAEKEFNDLRASVTPMLGDYMAGKVVDLHRLLAASYAGRSQEVTSGWQQLPGQLWPLYALEVGRAYLESGNASEAERHLRFAIKAERFWGNPGVFYSPNFFTATLAHFCLGRLLEQKGRKPEAIDAYQEFLGHFESSTARLPQIAEARAALKRLLQQ
jgi:tetratricopeptide (TPR) repeat protein